mmetsp:Transcript_12208/g.29410  ORF Transcript_12208/g.29410 Transcript_12208/m.29410 type:complete len:234 (+) Transcript_12208:299-1000(+)
MSLISRRNLTRSIPRWILIPRVVVCRKINSSTASIGSSLLFASLSKLLPLPSSSSSLSQFLFLLMLSLLLQFFSRHSTDNMCAGRPFFPTIGVIQASTTTCPKEEHEEFEAGTSEAPGEEDLFDNNNSTTNANSSPVQSSTLQSICVTASVSHNLSLVTAVVVVIVSASAAATSEVFFLLSSSSLPICGPPPKAIDLTEGSWSTSSDIMRQFTSLKRRRPRPRLPRKEMMLFR